MAILKEPKVYISKGVYCIGKKNLLCEEINYDLI